MMQAWLILPALAGLVLGLVYLRTRRAVPGPTVSGPIVTGQSALAQQSCNRVPPAAYQPTPWPGDFRNTVAGTLYLLTYPWV